MLRVGLQRVLLPSVGARVDFGCLDEVRVYIAYSRVELDLPEVYDA